MMISNSMNAAFSAASSAGSSVLNAVRNNPKTAAAVVLTAATGTAAFYNAGAIAAFATQTLTTAANYSPAVKSAAEYLNLLAPEPQTTLQWLFG